MKIILNKSCDEIKELLEVYSSLQQRVKQHVNKISECIACAKNGKINTDNLQACLDRIEVLKKG